MSAVLFTLAVAVWLYHGWQWIIQAACCGTVHIGIRSNPAGIVLAGSGTIQAACCCNFHNGIRSNPAGIVLTGSVSVLAAGCGTVHIGIRSNPAGIVQAGSGSVHAAAVVLFTLASGVIQLASS